MVRIGPEMRESSRKPVEPDPVSTGVGSKAMQAAVEISLYPLNGDYIDRINAFINRLNAHPELRIHTNTMSTQVWGPLDRVMNVLAQEMEFAAQGSARLIFVMKVIPGLAPP